MVEIRLKPHTIVMTVAPSCSGKSWFCTKVLIPFLDSHDIKNRYFSSDAIRRQLLSDEAAGKHDRKMTAVSAQAFNLLECGVDNHTSYPVNTDIVIVDATHLDEKGRKNIRDIAAKNHYSLTAIVFDYKNEEDYFKYLAAGDDKEVVAAMIKTFKEKTLAELETEGFQDIFKINTQDFDSIDISYEEKNNYIIVDYKKVCIVGDVHGCLDELIECVTDNKGVLYDKTTNKLYKGGAGDYHHHVLIGDFVDKGPKNRETIEFLHLNKDFFALVKGNHDKWCYLYLKGKIKLTPEVNEQADKFFDSVHILKLDDELQAKFFELVESSYDFILSDRFILTHAPCEIKYLGKSDDVSIKSQQTIRYPKRTDYVSDEEFESANNAAFEFLLREANENHLTHVFGHTPIPEVFNYKNKVCIDTGCVYGGYLSAITFLDDMWFLAQYESKQPKQLNKLTPYFNFNYKNEALEPLMNYGADVKMVNNDIQELISSGFFVRF